MDLSQDFGWQSSEKKVQTPNSAQRDGCDWGGERCGIRVSPVSPHFSHAARDGARKLSGIAHFSNVASLLNIYRNGGVLAGACR